MDYQTDDLCCRNCSTVLVEPYIQCVGCTHKTQESSEDDQSPVFLCLHCFAKGVELDGHESDHPYTVIKNNFHVFERHWTAVEEIQLLKAIADGGYGNWQDVAQQVRTKTSAECERHYNSCYIDNPTQGLPEFTEPELDRYPCPVIYKLSENPPRPGDNSLVNSEMAGYMPGRGDFMTEYDNFLEMDLRNMEFNREETDQLEIELNLAVLDVYQRCLKERRRRKRLIRKYGLINIHKQGYFNRRYARTIHHLLQGLRVFTQLVSPEEHDMYVEALHYEYELKHEIRNLQECYTNRVKRLHNINEYELKHEIRNLQECYTNRVKRLHNINEYELKHEIRNLQECYTNRVKRLHNISMFKMLKSSRDREKQNRHLLTDVLQNLKDETACQTWLQRQATMDSLGKGVTPALPNAPRKSAPPLDVSGLPGYDKISDKERELCAHIRLVPEAYVEFKRTLITECLKQGCLKLAQARTLIKIDVNKTRKIYDFLYHEGMINKDRK